MADDLPRGFASRAQREKWKDLVHDGRVTPAQFAARDAVQAPETLPDRAAPRTRTVGASRSFDAAKLGKSRY